MHYNCPRHMLVHGRTTQVMQVMVTSRIAILQSYKLIRRQDLGCATASSSMLCRRCRSGGWGHVAAPLPPRASALGRCSVLRCCRRRSGGRGRAAPPPPGAGAWCRAVAALLLGAAPLGSSGPGAWGARGRGHVARRSTQGGPSSRVRRLRAHRPCRGWLPAAGLQLWVSASCRPSGRWDAPHPPTPAALAAFLVAGRALRQWLCSATGRERVEVKI
ncbi:hypothetical protein GQ55_5G493000 [Panicum hallii var. hallii]|uniref:Uncharacterized protein n=1 Tax=Panicum hallii var. hallii TaxID=1504633 RepID=A0A2T7DRM1_9POAL|nr:hypothetical protein GQ55_5G493000 [Panicum hallii var. hallii]